VQTAADAGWHYPSLCQSASFLYHFFKQILQRNWHLTPALTAAELTQRVKLVCWIGCGSWHISTVCNIALFRLAIKIALKQILFSRAKTNTTGCLK
jgi:hypothetical protein